VLLILSNLRIAGIWPVPQLICLTVITSMRANVGWYAMNLWSLWR